MPMISVLIPAKNEERHIAQCLQSVAWSDDVVVVDSGSADKTVEISKSCGARIQHFQWNGQFPKKKNWALEHVEWKNDWVLILDADERITPELATEIQREVQSPVADGYFINRRFIFLDKWIRHCGYYPSWNLRLFRHERGQYERFDVGDTGSGDNEVHEHVVLDGKTAYLKHDMLHYAYPDIYTWMEKHNRYSNWEAQVEANGGGPGQDIGASLNKRRALRVWSRKLPFRPTLRFFYSYVIKRGFLDGRAGFSFCRLLSMYEYMIVLKMKEIRRREQGLAL